MSSAGLSVRSFQVATIILLVLVAIIGFGYYSQSTQISSLNAQVQSLNSEVQSLEAQNAAQVNNGNSQSAGLQAIANLQQSTIEASDVDVSANCIGAIATFQANYAGYLVITSKGVVTSGGASAYLLLSIHLPAPIGSQTTTAGYYEWSSPSVIPVSPGSVTLYLSSNNGAACVAGSQAAGTFSVEYFY